MPKRLTVESIIAAEKTLRENNVPPPYTMRITPAMGRSLLQSSPDGFRLTSGKEWARASIPLAPGERIVCRVGDTYLVARG